jgi:uncharacterized repeat protein (TIGR03803 family)
MLDRHEFLRHTQGRWCLAAFVVGACVLFARAAISSAAGQSENVIYAFNGGSGAYPYAPLVEQRGVLYGTTMSGGTIGGVRRRSGVFNGYGAVYALARGRSGYAQRLLYSFKGAPDGANPYAGLLAGPNGTLYGTTCYGGTAQVGTVFVLTPGQSGYTETILHAFGGLKQRDGSCPYGSLIGAANGTLVGTTELGGAAGCSGGCGTVFALVPNGSGYDERILYRFQGRNDGHNPYGGLLADASGALYGTTYYGGTHGVGAVFKLTPAGSDYSESVIHSFAGGSDGAQPMATLVADKQGTLYGTTYAGGGASCTGGCGTVFALTPSGSGYTESVLHAFQGGSDGYFPYAGLVVTAKGALYGTTFFGGGSACNKTGCGIVFELAKGAPGYKETILHRFSGKDGAQPGATMLSQGGTLFGTTYGGGGILCFQDDVNCGTVFSQIMPRLTSR